MSLLATKPLDQLIEEAQLFIDAAHKCYARIAAATPAVAATPAPASAIPVGGNA